MDLKVLASALAAAAAVTGGLAGDLLFDGTHGHRPESYIAPKEPEVRKHLEWFRDQKLALMVHFRLYSQLGIHESWPLVDAEASWSRLLVDWADGDDFKRQYRALNA